MNIDDIKLRIKDNLNHKIKIKVNGLRNKTYNYEGIVVECYPYIFMVDTNGENKSFSYVDILTKEIEIDFL